MPPNGGNSHFLEIAFELGVKDRFTHLDFQLPEKVVQILRMVKIFTAFRHFQCFAGQFVGFLVKRQFLSRAIMVCAIRQTAETIGFITHGSVYRVAGGCP